MKAFAFSKTHWVGNPLNSARCSEIGGDQQECMLTSLLPPADMPCVNQSLSHTPQGLGLCCCLRSA